MEDSFSSKLHIWNGADTASVPETPVAASSPTAAAAEPAHYAQRLFACEALNGRPRPHEGVTPYTLQWFLDIEQQRHGKHGCWIPRLLEFAKHAGETLLGLGNGLGTDWLQYARHGASVVVCSPSAEQLALVRRNFELRGLSGRFLQSAPAGLPLESASIDVVCVSSVLHEIGDPQVVVEEVYRVLKPGGKVLVVAPARYDVHFWFHVWFPWRRWLGWDRPSSPDTTVKYSARGLRRLFGRFVEHRVYKRHLRRGEVPHVWRWLPIPLLQRCMGRVLVLKAFKPLSAAITVPLAA